MKQHRRVSLVAVGALIAAILVPLGSAGVATAATLEPSNLATGFEIDGDKSGGTPPDSFDWDTFLTPPAPDGSFTFIPTGPYVTSEGNPSTGILDAAFAWDNGSLEDACPATEDDATGSPGSQTPDTNPWSPGPANVNDKGNLCSTASAYEVVTDADTGKRHAILYSYWTRLVGNGSVSILQQLEGPALGRCDDVLLAFDYEANLGTVEIHTRRWVPTAGDDCANPNGAGTWVETGDELDVDWAVGVRTEGPLPVGNQAQATFGEFAVDLGTAGLFDTGDCEVFELSTMLTRTGSDFTAQTQDYYDATDPMVLSNCGSISVTKDVVPAGFQSDDRFDYTIERAGGGVVLPDSGDATQIQGDLGIGETDTFVGVLGATDYTLAELVDDPWTLDSIVCTATQPGTGVPIEYVLDDPSDTFTVYPDTATDCVLTNATSTVTVTKQTLPDGSTQDFSFDVGGNAATLSDGESATFTFTPGTEVDLSEVVPDGWASSPEISCTDDGADIDEAGATATVTTVAGEDVSCVFTNTQLGTIVISKEAFGTPDNTEFDFVGDWTTGSPALGENGGFSINAETGDGANYTKTFTNVMPGDYSVSEPLDQHGTLLASLICTIGGEDTAITATSTADFTLAPGDTVTCYYVNVMPGHLLVIKETDPAEYDQDFGFTFGLAGSQDEPLDFTLNPLPGQATWSSDVLEPGQYVITEPVGAVPNWTLTDITCDIPGGTVDTDLAEGTATVDLPAGGTGQCTFTNTADTGSVTVTKRVVDVADDFPWSFDFPVTDGTSGEVRTLTVTNESTSATLEDLVPGVQYTIGEITTPGWTGTLECAGEDVDPEADGWQFIATPGSALECTAVNTADAASVTVEKTVAGVTDDYEWAFEFTLDPAEGVTPDAAQTIEGTGPSTESATWEGLLAGETYTLSEGEAAGWDVGELVCTGIEDSDEAPGVVTFVAQPGQVLECAITNTAPPIDLDVVKTAVGGDATFQFVLTPVTPVGAAIPASAVTEGGTGTAVFEGLVAGGTYSLTETDLPGWIEGELDCTVTHADESTEALDVTGFTVQAGDSIACEVENRAFGRVVVVKNVQGDDGTFEFAGSWSDSDFEITTTNGTGLATFGDLTPGTYSLEEIGAEGWETTDLFCTDGDENGVNSNVVELRGDIELDAGETVVCTFTNIQWGTLIIDKTTVPAGASQAFDFEWGPDSEAFSLTDEAEPFSTGPLAPGTYDVTETSELPRWVLTGIECVGAGGEGDPVVEGTTVSVEVPLRAAVYCEFTNAFRAPLLLSKTLVGSPQKQADGTFLVDYSLTVTNPGGLADTYDLNDELQYGSGITIEGATVTSAQGFPVNAAWNGIGDARIATQVPIEPGAVHTFDVRLTVRVPAAITTDTADCNAAPGEGTGLLNDATLVFTDGEAEAAACAPVPATLPPTGVTLGALWVAIGLLGGGAVLLLLRRRRTV